MLELNIGTNQLLKLPHSMGNMSRLVTLNLADNQLTDLPISMGKCLHLDSCLLARNPIKSIEMMRKYSIGTDHLVDYLSKRLFGKCLCLAFWEYLIGSLVLVLLTSPLRRFCMM